MTPMKPGTLIDGRYEIRGVIGEGGLGQVLLAYHATLGAHVAVKVLRPNVCSDADTVIRFEHEARACAAIRCDHVVRVLDIGKLPAGEPYFVMEYLQGESLDLRLERVGTLGEDDLAEIALQILSGLASVHAAGVLHRRCVRRGRASSWGRPSTCRRSKCAAARSTRGPICSRSAP